MDRRLPALRLVNLETAATTSMQAWPDKSVHYRMHPANMASLSAAQINACSLANNHVLDWGRPGLTQTLHTLRQAGIHSAGAGVDAAAAQAPAVLGNLKFDVQPQPDALTLARAWRAQRLSHGSPRPVVMLASTREGEEALWLQALMADADRLAAFRAMGVLWLLVPRHPQRFDEVHDLVKAQGLAVCR
eukprot:gene36709-59858_t